MDAFTKAYIEAIEFTDFNSDNEELQNSDGISPNLLASIEADCADFQEAYADDLAAAYDEHGYTPEQAGHDLWLTRNGHGAGFWDRGLGEVGTRLSNAARVYGACELYAGDDGLVYA